MPSTRIAVLLLCATACGRPDGAAAPAVAVAVPATAVESGAAGAAEEPEEGTVGVRELPGGLIVETTAGGRGRAARNGDAVSVRYEGRIQETGAVVARTGGVPLRFTLGTREMLPAWERALRGARPGADLKLVVPAALAYADRGLGPVPPDAALEFDVHVVAVERP